MGADKHKVYYVVIVGNVPGDHLYLRRIINKMFPQAIVESLYLNEESLSFLTHHCQAPDLIFLQHQTAMADETGMYSLLKAQADLQKVPVILVGDDAEEKVQSPLIISNSAAYFKRSFQLNSVEWIARNLLGKYDRLMQSGF